MRSYPTKKPAKCSNRTESIVTPISPDKIPCTPKSGSDPEPAVALSIDDLRRTTFSENTLIESKTANVKVLQGKKAIWEIYSA